MPRTTQFLGLLVLSVAAQSWAEPAAIVESARQVPVAQRVDVVVVGGDTGAVSAAVAAARQGAKVFLAAPHPYLGDDMTATLRLWLEPDEEPQSPLARAIFSHSAGPTGLPPQADGHRLPFTYKADQPANKKHPDPNPPSVLNDGAWGDPASQSVQYDKDVRITADLGQVREIAAVRVLAYRRANAGGYDVAAAEFEWSDDGKTWKPAAAVKNDRSNPDHAVLSTPVNQAASHVRVLVRRAEGVGRMLLGEIEILGPGKPETPAPEAPARPMPRPMHVKKVLDEALIEAKVDFLFQCYATDVLRDAGGNPCGIVMANRAGRQAVVAKVIVDATPRAVVARLAGGKFRPYPAGMQSFGRVVIGGEAKRGERIAMREVKPPFLGPHPNRARTPSGVFSVYDYTLQLPMKDDSYGAWAAADQLARDLTYHEHQQFTSDDLYQAPPDAMHAKQPADGPWQGVEQAPLAAFQPAGVPRLYVLGGCADMPRPAAAKLMRPLALIDLGQRIGRAAAVEAKDLAAPEGVRVDRLPTAGAEDAVAAGEVSESLGGARPIDKPQTIPQPARALPVLGRYKVIVVGGGTSGAPAGIAAARQGAKTLVIESLHGLGGVGTLGAISNYYHGNRVGFTATISGGSPWVIEDKMQWWRRSLREAGADIWFGAIGCGAVVQDKKVVGVVVATPFGRGAVLADAVIDATGNADVAAAAGAECRSTGAAELALQGTGLPPRQLGASYANTDFTIVDDADMIDVWHVLVFAKRKYPEAFDQGKLIDSRERRSIVGDFTMTVLDQLNERTHPDTIAQARGGPYDTHGYTVDPLLVIAHPSTAKLIVDIPYRCVLPRGLDGLLVTGLGLSVHRDALPLVRMQPDLQNLGYACGAAAAMASKEGKPLRQIDLRKLQRHLVEVGNLVPRVLEDKDSYPLSQGRFAWAVANLPKDRIAASVLFTQPDRALPLLRKAYRAAAEKDKLAYALTLAMLGDPTGADAILAVVRETPEWDAGWNYRGMGQFGNALSPLDACIVALGRSGERRAVPAILDKLKLLAADHAFSHHRAVGLALESLRDPAAAKPLAELLSKPGMSGHAQITLEQALEQETPGGINNEATRRASIRELFLARALYRCGDFQGQGRKTLEAYTRDLRGHWARHAKAVLEEKGTADAP